MEERSVETLIGILGISFASISIFQLFFNLFHVLLARSRIKRNEMKRNEQKHLKSLEFSAVKIHANLWPISWCLLNNLSLPGGGGSEKKKQLSFIKLLGSRRTSSSGVNSYIYFDYADDDVDDWGRESVKWEVENGGRRIQRSNEDETYLFGSLTLAQRGADRIVNIIREELLTTVQCMTWRLERWYSTSTSIMLVVKIKNEEKKLSSRRPRRESSKLWLSMHHRSV